MFLLADAKKAQVDIWVSHCADRVVRFAARELAQYLSRMSGAEFSVRTPAPDASDLQAHTLFLSDAATVLASSLPAAFSAGTSTDAFSIRTGDGWISVSGSNGRAVLYGVYELLEQMGCRFVEPGLETIPERSRLTAPVCNRDFAAAFPMRNIFRIFRHGAKRAPFPGLDPAHHLPQIDWMAKRKLNRYVFYADYYRFDLWEKHKGKIMAALLDRGFDIEVTQHSIQYFCPPDENLDYGDFGPETYRHRHPDWYLPTYAYGHSYQVRVERPEVQALIRQRFLDYLRRNPELCCAAMWPADVAVNRPEAELSHTDGYLKFWNQLADGLSVELPGKQISISAYMELQQPPVRVKPAGNLLCWYCPIDANCMYPMTHARNRTELERMRQWTAAMAPGQTIVFEYYGWTPPLTPLAAKMQTDLQAYRDFGLGGVYGWSGFSHNLMGQDFRCASDLFTLAHLMWDADADRESLRQTWTRAVFGPAAGSVMDFYRLLEQAHQAEARQGLYGGKAWIALDVLHQAQDRLASARREADAVSASDRIDLLEALLCQGATAVISREKPGPIVM